jgi:hypothetical protein
VVTSLLPVFARLFDDAGLFPPASRPMAEALTAHQLARTGPYGHMVGPFLCPLARVEELDACVAAGIPVPAELSLVVSRDEPRWRRMFLRPSVVQAEALLSVELPVEALRVPRYLELPPGEDVKTAVDEVVRRRARVKVRCGGVTPDMVPSPARLAEVLVACAARRLPLKATAGLHHPFRHHAAEIGGPQHGFLNLLAAASAAMAGASADELVDLLEVEVDDRAIVLERIDRRSRDLVASIGSCSIDEPVADLQALSLL